MDAEESMLRNVQAIKDIDPTTITWVYRNGVKALPWFTTVREKMMDPKYWGFFMPKSGCNPSVGVYTCGTTATANLYHDFHQTPNREQGMPSGDCGTLLYLYLLVLGVFPHLCCSFKLWHRILHGHDPTASISSLLVVSTRTNNQTMMPF
jgi:hypothetical protein